MSKMTKTASLKALLLSPEKALQLFLQAERIHPAEYHKDLASFEHDISGLRQRLKSRVIHGMDTYPYLYILNKLNHRRRRNFAIYFSVAMQKIEPFEADLDAILEKVDDSVWFLYFVAALQYYLL